MKVRNYDRKDEVDVKKIFTKYWTDNTFLNELAKELDGERCRFYVVEDDVEIVGVAGLRKAPPHLSDHADTNNPIELYIIASKYQGRGIGNTLVQRIVADMKGTEFTEMVCYSPETHDSSWKFYEKLEFKKHGIINDPDDGYPGMLWKKVI
jgi:N-acetylglutamate synthase-like GNAT family acetyltransferase